MEEADMLYTLAVILLIAWLLGVVGTYTIGAFVHVLLVIAIVLFVAGLLSGRTTVLRRLRRPLSPSVPPARATSGPLFLSRFAAPQPGVSVESLKDGFRRRQPPS